MSKRGRNPARIALLIVASLTAFVFVMGCGDDDSDDSGDSGDTAEAATEIGEPEGELNLVAWAGYVEDGSTDPKVDWVTDFEEETGCEVNVKIGNTSDEMVQLMRTGEYDGVSASGDATGRLYEGGDVVPVNTDLIPNYADVVRRSEGPALQHVRRPELRVPHGRGANLLMYEDRMRFRPLRRRGRRCSTRCRGD